MSLGKERGSNRCRACWALLGSGHRDTAEQQHPPAHTRTLTPAASRERTGHGSCAQAPTGGTAAEITPEGLPDQHCRAAQGVGRQPLPVHGWRREPVRRVTPPGDRTPSRGRRTPNAQGAKIILLRAHPRGAGQGGRMAGSHWCVFMETIVCRERGQSPPRGAARLTCVLPEFRPSAGTAHSDVRLKVGIFSVPWSGRTSSGRCWFLHSPCLGFLAKVSCGSASWFCFQKLFCSQEKRI